MVLPPYTFEWDTGAQGPSLFNLGAGTYSVTVTDANNITASESAILIDPQMVDATLVPGLCTSPYTITAFPEGGVNPFTYSWSTGSNGQIITVSAGGDYCVTITDANLCAVIRCINLDPDAELEVAVEATGLTCPDFNDGTVSAIASGGAPPYTYLWNNGAITPNLSNLPPGLYAVMVTDAGGCTATASATVDNQVPINIQLSPSNPICLGETNGSIGTNVSGGTPPYAYLWSTGQASPVLLNIGAGNYSLTVTDANGCVAVAQTSLSPLSSLTAGVVATDETCPDENDGSASVVASNGVGPYVYFWSNGETDQIINDLSPGAYQATVSDALGCMTTISVNIDAAPEFTLNVSYEQVSTCFAVDGSISLEVEEGIPPYTYEWNNGGTTAQLEGLASGTYIVTVTGGTGCQVVETIILEEPPALEAEINAPLYICEGENNGVATVTISSGTPPFVYQWSDGSSQAVNENLAAGAHSVTVSDANFCFDILYFGIAEVPGIDLLIEAEEVVCGPDATGSAAVHVSGGTSPYTYEWNNGVLEESIENLSSGTYAVTVSDANGCRATESVQITVVNDFQVELIPEDIDCYGEASGSIQANPGGGNGPYAYLWSNGATSAQVTNLIPGIYYLTATDANGCSFEQNAQIHEPDPLFTSISEFDANCFNGDDGMAFTLVGGGTPPYTYQWSNGLTTESLSGLSAGIYTLTITDANLCTTVEVITIGQPGNLTVNIDQTGALCANSADGTATAIVSGGTPPYSYAWSNGMVTASISGLAAGDYTLTVTDAAGCTATVEVSIAAPPALSIGFVINDNLCDDNDNGAISVTVEGGTPPYSYLWNNGATTSSITDLSSGTYTLTVTDDHECIKTFTATITHSPGLELIPASDNISCFGANDGRASVGINGGTAPFSYTWSNGANLAEITNLGPGNYTVTVSDAEGCSAQTSLLVEEPSELIAQVNFFNSTCFDADNGSASAQFSNGGTPPYSYAWSNGASGVSVNNLAPGNYELTVTDANDCSNSVPFAIAEPAQLIVTVTAIDASCQNSNTGSAAVTTSGGNGFFIFQWDNGEDGQIAHALSPGLHFVTVTDPLGCEAIGTVTIDALAQLNCAITILEPGGNGNEGSAMVEAIGGQAPFSYLWSDGQTGQTATGLVDGTYSVTVTDDNECSTSCDVNFFECVTIGDYVWLDINRDGLQGINEPPLSGVMVILSDNQSNNIDTTYTDDNGIYEFCVNAGMYKLTFNVPSFNQLFTEADVGLDDELDSDVDPETGMTAFFTINNENNLSLDAGIYNKCDNVTHAGIIGSDQYLCGPGVTPEPFTNEQSPTGGTGELEYLWMYSTVPGPFDPEIWLPVPGSNAATFSPGPIYETTYFTRCVRRECCSFYQESNIITVTVGSEAVASIIGPNPICEGEVAVYTAGPTGPDAEIFWDFGAAGNPQTATGPVAQVTYPSFGPQQIFLSVTENDCTSTALENITVTNSPIDCGNGLVIQVDVEQQQAVRVSWQISVGAGDLVFDVERSADGVQFFLIGQLIEATDTGTLVLNYSFLDDNPKRGRNYYRVVVSDEEGSSVTSNIEEALLIETTDLLFAYPNPAKDAFVLEFYETFEEDVRMDIISSSGMTLNTTVLPVDVKRAEMDVSALMPGVYFIRVRYGKNDVKLLKLTKH